MPSVTDHWLMEKCRVESKGLKRLWGCFASEKKGKNHKESKENNHKERKVKNAKHTKSLCALCEKPLSTLWLKKTTTKNT